MKLDPQTYELACNVADEAATKPAEVRESFVRSTLDDPSLARWVLEHLRLRELNQSRPLLEAAPADTAEDTVTLADTLSTRQPGAQSPLEQLERFTIVAELGRGGMGVVYHARDERLHRDVAVKTIRFDRDVDEEHLERFRREARTAAKLSHPNIVNLYEIGCAAGVDYIVMKLVQGENLQQLGRQPPAMAARWSAEIAAAAGHAHANRVVHRDLKPANILIDEEGRPQVADFGLALQLDAQQQLTRDGCLLGTPSYMPPEQAAGGRRVGPAADVYAIGGILYFMLTGSPPLRGENAWETLSLIQEAPPRPPRELRPDVPKDLETICLKCLEKEPARRYASAAALGEDLRRFLDGRPIQARPVGAWERTLLWCKRRPAAALSMLLAVLMLAATPLVASRLDRFAARAQEAERGQRQVSQQLDEAAREVDEKQRAAKQASTAAERGRHAGLIRDAAEQLASGRRKVARSLLAQCKEAHRGWEWRYLVRQCDACVSLSPVPQYSSVATSADGVWIIGGGRQGVISVWDADTRRTVLQLEHPEGAAVDQLAVSADHELAAASGARVAFWDLLAEEQVGTLPELSHAVACLQYDHSGLGLATGTSDGVQYWDAGSKQQRWSVDNIGPVVEAAFDPSDHRLAVLGVENERPVVALLDVVTGERQGTLEAAGVLAMRWTKPPSGGAAAGLVMLRHDALEFWSWTNRVWSKQRTVGAADATCLAVSRDGGRVVAACQGGLEVYDSATGARVLSLGGPSSSAVATATGELFATVDSMGEPHQWHTAGSGAAADVYGCTLGQFSDDLRTFIAVDPALGQAHVFSPKKSYDRRFTVEGGGFVERGTTRRAATVSTLAAGHAAMGLSLSADQSMLALGGQTVALWGLPNRERIAELTGGLAPYWNLAFNADATLLAAASPAGITIWDVERESVLREIEAGPSLALAFSHDGRRIAATSHAQGFGETAMEAARTGQLSPSVFVYDVASGARNREFSGENVSQFPTSVAWSSADKQLGASMGDGSVIVWDATTGRRRLLIRAHERAALGIDFHPQDDRLATAGNDGVKIWDLADGTRLLHLMAAEGGSGQPATPPAGRIIPPRMMASANDMAWPAGQQDTITWNGTGESVVAFSKDGRRLASWGYSVRNWWDGSPVKPVDPGAPADAAADDDSQPDSNPFGPAK